MTATISVNGTSLDDLVAQGAEGSTGLHTVPGKRGSNIDVPQRHGQLHVPHKRYQSTSLVFPMWVRGVNPDGTIPSGTDTATRLAFHARVRALVKLFVTGELVTIRHTLSDGAAREITGEVTDVWDWTIRGSGRHTLGQVSVGLNCADPFWTDLTDSVETFSVTTGNTATLDDFSSASAPMDDLIVRFHPQSNPELTQDSTGVFLAYDGVIDAGRKLEVNTATWAVTGTIDAGGTWVPGSAPTQHIARIRHGGSPRLFSLAPQSPSPVVSLVHTGGGTATASITGKQRHLVP
jgi:hypothetical protein